MQERHKDLSWFGQEKALRPAGGGCFDYLAPKCLNRGEYKSVLWWMLSSRWKRCVVVLLRISFLCLPFYSSKGRPRLHGVGDRVGVDRGVVRWPNRGFRTGVASSRLVTQYLGDDYACFWIWLLCPVLDRLYVMATVVRVVEVLSFTAWLFFGKERVRSRVRCRAKPCWSERCVGGRDMMFRLSHCARTHYDSSGGKKLQKGAIWWVLAPYHVSRDCRFSWEHDRCIKCPGSHTRVRRRTASLRSRPVDSYEPVSYSTVDVQSSLGRFTWPFLRVRGYGCCRVLAIARVNGGVESRASIFIRVLSLCASVRVPLIDNLDSIPQVSIRALALE